MSRHMHQRLRRQVPPLSDVLTHAIDLNDGPSVGADGVVAFGAVSRAELDGAAEFIAESLGANCTVIRRHLKPGRRIVLGK